MLDRGDGSHVLLVEGEDDRHVIHHLCNRSEKDWKFEIVPGEGWENLRETIGAEIKAPGRKIIGIIVDADDDVDARWCAVAQRLKQAGLVSVPCEPVPNGAIIPGIRQQRIPRVGIWMMPDNELPGELEDFIARMIPGDDAIWPLSQKYIDCIPEAERKFKPKKKRRAQVHAWLATREKPRPMGTAITAQDLQMEANSQNLIDWLQRLFGPSDPVAPKLAPPKQP